MPGANLHHGAGPVLDAERCARAEQDCTPPPGATPRANAVGGARARARDAAPWWGRARGVSSVAPCACLRVALVWGPLGPGIATERAQYIGSARRDDEFLHSVPPPWL